jgi:uncharacterized protein YbcI
MSSTEPQDLRPTGQLAAAISKHIVRLYSEYTGRGPTRVRTTIRENHLLCIAQDSMTKGERRLVEAGEADTVVSIRRKFQATMRDDLIGGVELLTGRKVVSFMSDHDAVTDHAAEIFVLDGEPQTSIELDGDGPPASSTAT